MPDMVQPRLREVSMKRSEINAIMAEADEFIRSFGFVLPPFAYWSPEEMKARRAEIDGIVSGRMGWDITDYGQGNFERLGLFLFTLRNGRLSDLQRGGGMCYAEKLLISKQDQISPMHRHYLKAEDIINRGGATLAIELFGSASDGSFDGDAGGTVHCDGIARDFAPGEVLMLAPGESVTLMPGDWHAFWGEGGDVLIGEVSTVNDDETDNWFREPIGRFAEIDEDEAPTHLLVSDYARWLG
jgi:D-lyxose ketol-isomerase